MFKKLSDALRRFQYGRNGTDALNIALLMAGLLFLLLGSFLWRPLSAVSIAALVYALFRTYSRNLTARRQENSRFLRCIAPLKDRKNRYFRCPKCRQTVRVPRGKGRISIHCPKCGERFEKRT